jgi:CubicO group peptidase (beta-lactamase class C family)
VVPAAAVQETRKPLADVGKGFGDYAREKYGLGWHIGRYRDDVMIHHFGSFAGTRAHISYLPDRKVGAAAFINTAPGTSDLVDVIVSYIYDHLAGREDALSYADEALANLVERHANMVTRIQADKDKRAEREWTLSQPWAAYAGTYESKLAGTVEVTAQEDGLTVQIGVLKSTAEPFTQPESIRLRLIPPGGMAAVFDMDDDNNPIAISIVGERFDRK